MENKEDVLNVKYSREEMSKIKKIGYKEGFNSALDEIEEKFRIYFDKEYEHDFPYEVFEKIKGMRK